MSDNQEHENITNNEKMNNYFLMCFQNSHHYQWKKLFESIILRKIPDHVQIKNGYFVYNDESFYMYPDYQRFVNELQKKISFVNKIPKITKENKIKDIYISLIKNGKSINQVIHDYNTELLELYINK